MSSSFTARPGAVGEPPQHYGNPLGEQKALASGAAIVDLSDRAVITVTGPDRLTWLDSLTSQSLAHLQPGDSAETLLLDPSGRLEHAIRVVDDGTTAWLLVDGSQGPALAAWLDRMRFMLRVEVADRTAEFSTVGTLGRQELPAAVTWHDPWVDGPGHTYAASRPDAPWGYSEVLVDRAADLGAFPAAGTLALEALRIAAWRPRLAMEADEKSIPHELDWLRSAVHLSKGCYRGQETVAKVHNLGHPPRRLVMLHLDGSDGVLPAAGSAVLAGQSEVGRVTSVALHYELGPIALAVVKRGVDPAADLLVSFDGTLKAAAQEVIVPTDAGASANVPRLPRLGAVRR
ncbi:glycine cleavage T C-terminal barrel domain-containing protein [Salinibacterium sp.]|uniref:CAF17-like 4Fe-4S cluster assembly/insertion protein YgfZ n=1 Tax=Salinibacterium sp. TaxID=1915057 RepID=UPI00286C3351|nr:glycine cleavage T C-terminal barrel domain-containing protein [Salinibacterium sp.]